MAKAARSISETDLRKSAVSSIKTRSIFPSIRTKRSIPLAAVLGYKAGKAAATKQGAKEPTSVPSEQVGKREAPSQAASSRKSKQFTEKKSAPMFVPSERVYPKSKSASSVNRPAEGPKALRGPKVKAKKKPSPMSKERSVFVAKPTWILDDPSNIVMGSELSKVKKQRSKKPRY